jgi:hypothetical protein
MVGGPPGAATADKEGTMADRTPPVWTHADADYYGSEGVCRKCGKPMEVGQAYWLDRSMMIREPVPPFHAQCPGAAVDKENPMCECGCGEFRPGAPSEEGPTDDAD